MSDETLTSINEMKMALAEMDKKLEVHFAEDKQNGEKITSMYKLFVTGNGNPSIPERVRVLESWIGKLPNEHRVREIEDFISSRKKIEWIAILFVIGDVGLRIWNLLYPQVK